VQILSANDRKDFGINCWSDIPGRPKRSKSQGQFTVLKQYLAYCANAIQQIFVSGGFARSPYLFKQIEDFARLRPWRIRVWREHEDVPGAR
jgi:hypothetical protein